MEKDETIVTLICDRCNKNESNGNRSCPYACEINDDCTEDYCNCCDECAHECAMDI